MALPSSGPLTLSAIQTEFGGSSPTSLTEYYAGGGLVPSGTSGTNGPVPSSGAIRIQNFYGTQNQFGGGNQSVTDLATLGAAMFAGASTPTAGGTLTVNGVSLGSYDYVIKSGTTVSSFTNSDWFTTTEDTRSAVIAVNGNLTINGGVTFTPSNRKLFTFIYVNGNLTLNGTISMTDKGANHSGTGNSGGYVAPGNIRIYNGTHGGVSNPQVPSSGGSGAAGQSAGCPGSPTNPAGSSGSAGGTGGGGGGGNCSGGTGGAGATGTSFVGGGGGGAMNNGYSSVSGGTAVANGGRGGDAGSASISGGAAGGTGQPGGSAVAGGSNGATGLPGVVIIICTGTISGSGTIDSYGRQGGAGGHASGGSAGGGSINVLYGSSSSSWTLNAAGGPYNNSNPYNRNGGAGGTGTARLLSI